MLLLSQTCFTDALQAASTKEGEKWMHYYMLGKASENLKKPVDTYLSYYQKVCGDVLLLHQCEDMFQIYKS